MQDNIFADLGRWLKPFALIPLLGTAFTLSGIGLMKGSVVGLLLAFCVQLNLAARHIYRATIVLLLVGILVWIDLLPPVPDWRPAAAAAMSALSPLTSAAKAPVCL